MLTRKRLLILANSKKGGGRCLAGPEMLADGGGIRPGRWVRPVSRTHEGALTWHQCLSPDGSLLRVGDVADAPLLGPEDSPSQPENWHLAEGAKWEKPARVLAPPLRTLEERPDHLWLEPEAMNTDRASAEHVAAHPPPASLYLIRAERFRVLLRTVYRSCGEKREVRGDFRYHGVDYRLHVTDPVLHERYDALIPPLGRPPVEISSSGGPSPLLCVSLAREFQGYHYKAAATVFEGTDAMRPPPDARLFTVGHSNHPVETFVALLKSVGITAVADVRSSPYSRFVPQYNREALAASLRAADIAYVYLGGHLGARRDEPECYDGDKARYPLIAATPLFREGIARIGRGLERHNIALMCAEKDPLTCHRFALVCRHLRRDFAIHHLHEDGRLETQADAESRLLDLLGLPPGDLFRSRDELIEHAYDTQGERLAYVRSADPEGTP